MFLKDIRREWAIQKALKEFARQRVWLVLQPGNVWVIENAARDDENTDAALKTCYMRGWVEPLVNSLPKGRLQADGSLPTGPLYDRSGPLWKLTDSGWAAIHRAHEWTLIGILIAALAFLATLASL